MAWAGSPAARKADNGVLHASGEAWLRRGRRRRAWWSSRPAAGRSASTRPPSAPPAGSINGSFDAGGRLGADWRGALNLTLQPSTLANAPLWGYAKLTADARHVSNADVDLRVGPNVLAAKGSFGAERDMLDWRIDAPSWPRSAPTSAAR